MLPRIFKELGKDYDEVVLPSVRPTVPRAPNLEGLALTRPADAADHERGHEAEGCQVQRRGAVDEACRGSC